MADKPEENLPSSPDTEKFILGSIILNHDLYDRVSGVLQNADFSVEKHRLIFARMQDIKHRGDRIDRVTLVDDLQSNGQLKRVDGMDYIIALDEGLPAIENIDSYVRIVKRCSVERKSVLAAQELIDKVRSQTGKPEDRLISMGGRLFDLQQELTSTQLVVRSPAEVYADVGNQALFMPWVNSPGIPTGFEKLDEKTGGFYPGELIIIAAETSNGKTALTLNFLLNIAKAGRGVLLFTGEMDEVTILHRLAAINCGMSFTRWRRGWMSLEEQKEFRASLTSVMGLPIYLDSSRGISVHDVCNRTTRMVKDGKVEIGFLDYIQLINLYESGDGKKFRDEREALTFASKKFMSLAHNLKIPFAYLSQFSRAKRGRDKGDRKPRLSDIMGASIENDAHLVMAIYREEFDRPNVPEIKGQADIMLLKGRNVGLGTVKTRYEGKCFRFTEDYPEPGAADEKETS